MNTYYSPFEVQDSQERKGFVQLEVGYYIWELMDVSSTIYGDIACASVSLEPKARIIQNNGQQRLELPNNDKAIETRFWLFSYPKDELNKKVKGVGFLRNYYGSRDFSNLFQVISGYTMDEIKHRYSKNELEKEGIELIEPTLNPNGTKDNPYIDNVAELTQQWASFLKMFVISNNSDPDVKEHKLVKGFVQLKPSTQLKADGEPYINPEITYVKGSLDPVYMTLSTREYELYQEMVDSQSPAFDNEDDDFVLPGGTTRF